ncbi:hypothetical protein [Methylotuvimicrobium buryatense]|uniref:Uncharacterized protein n=1 Tax=Methylotuvimicrobium buryatense TaxID=95641 RepID=A0A4P9UIQ1_METBY|nr:hypothetical protein [Methylotuvimicrobium buryatense]QCW81022.1 hypothetical protein EQU24_01200 [Methylotuvimicrobium buryatense]
MKSIPPRGDSIFQLSLTEIAFSLIFILLILLGWMYASTDRKYKEVNEKLEKLQTLDTYKDQLENFENQLKEIGANPDEIISKLIENTKIISESVELKSKIDEQDEQLTQLVNIREMLEELKEKSDNDITDKELAAAIELVSNLSEKIPDIKKDEKKNLSEENIKRIQEQALNALELMQYLEKSYFDKFDQSIDREKLQKIARTLIESSDINYARELSDLKGQVAYLQNRLSSGPGRDHPPCWADENTGRIEYLFDIVITQEGLVVDKAWPEHRNSEALDLPRIKNVLGKVVSKGKFINETIEIFNISKKKECRHFVILKNRVNDLTYFNAHRFAVNGIFYTYEPR